MNRCMCRRCGANSTKKAAVISLEPSTRKNPSPANAIVKTPALAPWASPAVLKQREEQLIIAISAAKAAGGCEEHVTKLEAKLVGQQKKAATPVPVLTQIESTRGFIGRATKRQGAIEAQIAELQAESDQMQQEVTDAKERLATLEAEAATMLHVKPATANASSEAFKALEEAVRTLMVTMHASREQLPAQVTEAVTAVARCLPTPQPSKDYEGNASDSDENADDDGLMMELDGENSDEKLLEIARRLKAKRIRIH